MTRDPEGEGMMKVSQVHGKSNMALTHDFIRGCLEVSRDPTVKLDGVAIIDLILAMFENMPGAIDDDVSALLGYVVDELSHQQTVEEPDSSENPNCSTHPQAAN